MQTARRQTEPQAVKSRDRSRHLTHAKATAMLGHSPHSASKPLKLEPS